MSLIAAITFMSGVLVAVRLRETLEFAPRKRIAGLNGAGKEAERAVAIVCPVDLDTLRAASGDSIHLRTRRDGAVRRLPFPSRPGVCRRDARATTRSALARSPCGHHCVVRRRREPPPRSRRSHRARPSSTSGAAPAWICFLAARAVGPGGRAIGIDMTEAMAERARTGAVRWAFDNVEVRVGDALSLPVESESVDVVISNGVLNLTPDKHQAFGEVFRILKPGGQFLYGDIVVASELSESIRRNIDLWTG